MINKSQILIVVVAVLAANLACSFPLYITPAIQPTSALPEIVDQQPLQTETLPTLEPTQTVEPTATSMATALAARWDGPWTIWFGDAQTKVEIDFVQDGIKIVGNAVHKKGHSIAFTGQIAADGVTVNGNWEATDGTSGTFTMYDLDSFAQFNGNLDGRSPFCGARVATNKPASCFVNITK